MYKNLSDCEKVLISNLEVRQYLVKMSEIVRNYFPENTSTAEIWCNQMFEGFKIFVPNAEEFIDCMFKVCFWQQSSEEGTFSSSAPYKLDHVEFHSLLDEENPVDVYFSYCGNWAYSGWATEYKIAPEQVKDVCLELFTLFQDLTISV
ncbi:hypothetical protein A0J48_007325 [Sphaerospermopsis aphanizomenoides BCCUSP55]|uniref:hypothetical protein n=1 Tax=Sphaerospermopsis aphanizomenoides TaxID=459663 RepID=UPI001902EA21|nr:hypothetical protein [Sphaerospermopsis aphanizomenoides]MBK1987347.1 hypothetical protein [Sphaerospermopsis aphanizomenoides BCCUSP55]